MDVYAFLTTSPNAVVKPIHPTRMPVMLVGEEAQDVWMDGSPDEAYASAQPYPANLMKIIAKGEKFDPASAA